MAAKFEHDKAVMHSLPSTQTLYKLYAIPYNNVCFSVLVFWYGMYPLHKKGQEVSRTILIWAVDQTVSHLSRESCSVRLA